MGLLPKGTGKKRKNMLGSTGVGNRQSLVTEDGIFLSPSSPHRGSVSWPNHRSSEWKKPERAFDLKKPETQRG